MSFKICFHDWKPAYWREAEPSYKRCDKFKAIRAGTPDEKQIWALNSPWKRDAKV